MPRGSISDLDGFKHFIHMEKIKSFFSLILQIKKGKLNKTIKRGKDRSGQESGPISSHHLDPQGPHDFSNSVFIYTICNSDTNK